MRVFHRRVERPYRVGVDRRERVLALTTAAEAVLLAYGAVMAFITPSERSEHNVVLSLALLSIAAPLAWHAAGAVWKRASQADPLLLRVIIPNVVLLMMCVGGVLGSTADGYGPWPALIAVLAVTFIIAAIRLTRRQVRVVAGT